MGTSKRMGFILCFVFIICIAVSNCEAADAQITGDDVIASVTERVSIDVQDVPLSSVLKILSEQSGLNFVASDALKGKNITLYLTDVSIKEAMDTICKANNLMYERVGTGMSNIFLFKWAIIKKIYSN